MIGRSNRLTPVVAAGVALLTISGGALAQLDKRGEFRASAPLWVMAGQTVTVTLKGQDLAATDIQFDEPGITARVLKSAPLMPKNDEERRQGNTSVEVEVTAAAGVKPGSYKFKLVREGAAAVEGRLLIDVAAPEMPEMEPNDTLRKPQALPAGPVTVTGKLDNEGVDVFRIDGKAGETWRFEVFARRLNAATKLEAVLRLRDPRMASVRAAVDQGQDCAIEYTLPTDGPYLIELFDGDNKAGGDQAYRLTIRKR